MSAGQYPAREFLEHSRSRVDGQVQYQVGGPVPSIAAGWDVEK
jgi:hypothetical protein